MSHVQVLNTRKSELIKMQEKMLNAALEAKVKLTDAEESQFTAATAEIADINTKLDRIAAIAKGKQEIGEPTSDLFLSQNASKIRQSSGKVVLSEAYNTAFWSRFNPRADATRIDMAALNEGTSSEGGFTVPVIVEDTIIPLAPLECSVRKLALNIVTETDIKIPVEATRTVAGQKTESGDTSYSFGGTNPSFGQHTLASYMNGVNVPVSIELASDVRALQPFVTMDLSRGISNWEENMFVNGSGDGEPEGVLTSATTANTAGLSSEGIDAILDLTGYVNPYYYPNSSFLMHRLTGIQLQKAQLALEQFQTFWTRQGGQDYLLGYPVYYSYQMPVYSASPAVSGKVVFGDFKAGCVIGDRHTSAVTARVLTELGALQGIINILGWRRSDMRVRMPEAIAQLTVNG